MYESSAVTSGTGSGPSLLDLVRQLHSATELLVDAAAERYGISRIDLRCLEILDRQGPRTAGQLAEASHLSPAAITKVLRRLEQGGYVVVSTPAEDRRRQVAEVTVRHQQLRGAVWRPVQEQLERVLSVLTDDDRAVLATTLTDLAQVSEQQARRIRSEAGGA